MDDEELGRMCKKVEELQTKMEAVSEALDAMDQLHEPAGSSPLLFRESFSLDYEEYC